MDARVARCCLIARVLVADGMMGEPERAFLAMAMETARLTEAERRVVTDLDGWTEAEQVIARMSEADKRTLVDELIEAALTDGKLSPHETKAVGAISAALGIG